MISRFVIARSGGSGEPAGATWQSGVGVIAGFSPTGAFFSWQSGRWEAVPSGSAWPQ